MLDSAALEKRGVHTVTIVWDNFEKAARAQARVQGVPDLALALIPRRQGTETAEDQRAKADAALADVVAGLLRRGNRS